VIGLIGAFMTTAYMTRATYLTFFGSPRGAAAGEHHDEVHGLDHGVHDPHAPDVTPPEPLPDEVRVPAMAMAHAAHGDAVSVAAHDTDVAHDVHGAHDSHGGHEAHGPHESPALITVPLVILAFLAVVSGYLNAAPFKIEKFTEWVATAGDGVHFPELAHAEFEWIKAVPSIVLVALGFVVSLAVCKAIYGERRTGLRGITERVAPLRWGYNFLWNKYYLDHLYEKVIVPGLVGPIAKGAYWINQNVLDRTVNEAGIGARKFGGWIYRNIDQRVVDGAVNASGDAARGSGTALQPTSSGKVNQYGALLFGAAAIGALVLVIVNT
jgi:NADH-quinone oxidoreductase subunit L